MLLYSPCLSSLRLFQFNALLAEHDFSAFAMYDSVKDKLKGDPRFELLNDKERQRAFSR